MGIRLVVTSGPDEGRVFEFGGYNRVVLGRQGSTDRQGNRPKDPYLSRFHFLLETAGDVCGVRDLGSRSGIYVDGTRVDAATLRSGSTLRAGRSHYRVEIQQESASAQPLPQRPVASALSASASLADYERLQLIAEGSLGLVYQAVERLTGRSVAIKVLRPERSLDERAIDHFLREMEVWRGLQHPNIVRVFAVGQDAAKLWLAMEYVEGSDLEEQVQVHGPLGLANACRIGVQVLSALAYGHSRGIVHRDVKPANVLLGQRTAGPRAMLADYGLARNFLDTCGARLTTTGDVKGTPLFMAPEQLLECRSAGPAADLYGLGATLFYAVTGGAHIELGEDPGQLWQRVLDGERIPLHERRKDAPPSLCEAIDLSVSPLPDRRPSTAQAMADLLRRAETELTR